MSYISSLNLINTDSSVDSAANVESFKDELTLWANAQFTFHTDNSFANTITTEISRNESCDTTESRSKEEFLEKNSSHHSLSHHSSPEGSFSGLPRLAPALPKTETTINTCSSAFANPSKKQRAETKDSKEKLLADEDKRRRNTAASARFRMKKKLREQALEQKAKEITTKAENLEIRVKELEMEAKWLRALVVEKDPKLLKIIESSAGNATH
ncbi:hypothetical protein EC973_001113 [Apophysomyces ossiformis]|uniref:BZIP domain-containing protein n=1 Tax=Apophysomyces ossiformis TaxID=679940 RepID=A0A8H7EPL1_9FUNG|nr:hypothetical protein EC973_001113 [Apophysomyces ossiformis]